MLGLLYTTHPTHPLSPSSLSLPYPSSLPTMCETLHCIQSVHIQTKEGVHGVVQDQLDIDIQVLVFVSNLDLQFLIL